MRKRKNRRVKFEDALAGATDEQVEFFYQLVKKRRKRWLILSLIPVVNWFTAGYFIYCNQVYRAFDGKESLGFLSFFIFIWSLIIFPFIGVRILNHMPDRFIDSVVLGCGEELKQWHYK